jgi:hypothetical protein
MDLHQDEDEGEGAEPSQKKVKAKYTTNSATAGKSDVKQLFSRQDFDGADLPEDRWRCVLCSCQHWGNLERCVFSSPEGNANLRKHLLNSHGVKVLNAADVAEEKSNKKAAPSSGSKQGPLKFNFSSPAPMESVKVAVVEYILDEQLSFRTSERPAFQKLKESLVGRAVVGPSHHDVRDALDAEERRIQLVMKDFFKRNVEHYSLSGDGKKCIIKGRPMYAIVLHTISKQMDPVLLPLCVGETDGKTAQETKRWVLKKASAYELSARSLFVFIGDEAEEAAGTMLGRFQACSPHCLSMAAKRTFQVLGLTTHGQFKDKRLLECTKDIVQFCVRWYRARQKSDEIREEENHLRAIEGKRLIGAFSEFSKTRFLLHGPELRVQYSCHGKDEFTCLDGE